MERLSKKELSRFFIKEKNKWIFKGDKLELYVPKIFEEKGLLVIGEHLTTLGIFQARINDTYYCNFMFLGKLLIDFISYQNVTEDEYQYIVFTLIKDSVFINNSTVVKNGDILFNIFNMFISFGKIPPFLNYEDVKSLFDNDFNHCGISLNINHVVFEMIYAHIFRDVKDPYTFYRHSPMTDPPKIVPLKQVSHMPSSVTARIAGGYLSEGITSALVDDSKRNPSTIENLLRS